MPKTTRTIWNRGNIASTAHVIQYDCLLTNHLSVDETLLVMVRQGQKKIECQGESLLLSSGEAVLVSAGCAIDVTNIPPPNLTPYEAHWLCFPTLKLQEPASAKDSDKPHALYNVSAAFDQAFHHTVTAIKDPADIPETVARKRMEEMCEWLESFGLILRPGGKKMLSQDVRKLVMTDLLRNWTASDVARQFAMSEATFRRKLSAENTSFRHLITEARMGHALTLLQVTDLTISQIALDVGYENPSKFSARFRTRFGFNPGQIRAQEVDIDPIILG